MENTYRLPKFGQLWKETWAIYKEKREKLFILSAPLLAVNLFSFFALGSRIDIAMIGVHVILGFLVYSFSQAAFFGNLVNNKDSYKEALNESPKYMWASLLNGFIVACGAILLIVPGIIWSMWMVLFPVIMADQKLKPLQALAKSREYMRGQVIPVIGYTFLFSIVIGIPGSILSGLGEKYMWVGVISVVYGVFVTQAMAVYLYNIYKNIKSGKPEAGIEAEKWMKKAAVVGGVVAVAALAVIITVYIKYRPEIQKAIDARNEMSVEEVLDETQGVEEGL